VAYLATDFLEAAASVFLVGVFLLDDFLVIFFTALLADFVTKAATLRTFFAPGACRLAPELRDRACMTGVISNWPISKPKSSTRKTMVCGRADF
jgi:hypothetical protein